MLGTPFRKKTECSGRWKWLRCKGGRTGSLHSFLQGKETKGGRSANAKRNSIQPSRDPSTTSLQSIIKEGRGNRSRNMYSLIAILYASSLSEKGPTPKTEQAKKEGLEYPLHSNSLLLRRTNHENESRKKSKIRGTSSSGRPGDESLVVRPRGKKRVSGRKNPSTEGAEDQTTGPRLPSYQAFVP